MIFQIGRNIPIPTSILPIPTSILPIQRLNISRLKENYVNIHVVNNPYLINRRILSKKLGKRMVYVTNNQKWK